MMFLPQHCQPIFLIFHKVDRRLRSKYSTWRAGKSIWYCAVMFVEQFLIRPLMIFQWVVVVITVVILVMADHTAAIRKYHTNRIVDDITDCYLLARVRLEVGIGLDWVRLADEWRDSSCRMLEPMLLEQDVAYYLDVDVTTVVDGGHAIGVIVVEFTGIVVWFYSVDWR